MASDLSKADANTKSLYDIPLGKVPVGTSGFTLPAPVITGYTGVNVPHLPVLNTSLTPPAAPVTVAPVTVTAPPLVTHPTHVPAQVSLTSTGVLASSPEGSSMSEKTLDGFLNYLH